MAFGRVLAEFPTADSVLADIPDRYADVTGAGTDSYTPQVIPQVASLFSQEQRVAPYDVWHMETMVRWEEGLGAMPLAPPVGGTGPQNKIGTLPTPKDTNRQPMAIVRLSAPYGFMVVFWVGRRMKLQPTVPLPKVNANAIFLASEFHPSPPIGYEDNTLIYSWSARYLFLLQKPLWLLDGINPGASPAYTLKTTDNVIPATVFKQVF